MRCIELRSTIANIYTYTIQTVHSAEWVSFILYLFLSFCFVYVYIWMMFTWIFCLLQTMNSYILFSYGKKSYFCSVFLLLSVWFKFEFISSYFVCFLLWKWAIRLCKVFDSIMFWHWNCLSHISCMGPVAIGTMSVCQLKSCPSQIVIQNAKQKIKTTFIVLYCFEKQDRQWHTGVATRQQIWNFALMSSSSLLKLLAYEQCTMHNAHIYTSLMQQYHIEWLQRQIVSEPIFIKLSWIVNLVRYVVC